MNSFLKDLQRRNLLLYYFGWLCFAGGMICLLLTQTSQTIILGINAFIKPMKFFFSVGIFSWSMGWYLYHLEKSKKVRSYSFMVVLVMSFELFVITWQAANGRLSHFNTSTPLYGVLFTLMGIAITILAAWTGYMGYLFFRQKQFNAPMPYIWGIRLGIILFVLFSFEGGLMAARLSHTVGAADGGAGLPVVNWSKQYGDLRIAHFIGMHSLQILPLFGYYLAGNNRSVQLFGLIYFVLAMLLFIQALKGIPLLF